MTGAKIFWLAVFATVLATTAAEREEKHFSLFSVVTFKNDACTSSTDLAGGARNGTCFTSTECNDKSGTSSGNCASGFGVCCVFLANAGTATVSQNRTYLRNAEFPTISSDTTGIIYTVNKMQDDICQMRLDFVNFVIGGPSTTDEQIPATGISCGDTFTTVVSSGQFQPTLCGTLTGQHLYVDVGAESGDLATFTFAFAATTTITTANAMRSWDIYTQQIPCWAPYRAPDGCQQFHTTPLGKIASFNFANTPGTQGTWAAVGTAAQNPGINLSMQDVRTCIRREAGMCCIQYQVCLEFQANTLTGQTATTAGGAPFDGTFSEGYSFDTHLEVAAVQAATINIGYMDILCTNDYIGIPSSVSGPCPPDHVTTYSRYCGARFGAAAYTAGDAMPAFVVGAHGAVCDCSEPFEVTFHTDVLSDNTTPQSAIASPTQIVNRGFCLDYMQLPCVSML